MIFSSILPNKIQQFIGEAFNQKSWYYFLNINIEASLTEETSEKYCKISKYCERIGTGNAVVVVPGLELSTLDGQNPLCIYQHSSEAPSQWELSEDKFWG